MKNENTEIYVKLQNLFVKDHKIVPGTIVRPLRYPKSYEIGWGYPNAGSMKNWIGLEMVVRSIGEEQGINTKLMDGSDGCWWPFFVLEKVRDGEPLEKEFELNSEYTATILKNGVVKVGCQTFPKDVMTAFIREYGEFVKD